MVRRISQQRDRHEGGFTLIELLVVIVILGILSAVVVFAVRGSGDKGASSAFATDAKTVRTAEEAFCAKFGQYGTEDQLAGLAPAPDGRTYRFLAEKSKYHAVGVTSGGPCTAANVPSASGFSITCNVAESGCGAGGAVATGGTLVVGETFGFPTTNGGANTYNPATDTNGSTHAYWESMYNGLLGYDAHGNPMPELATRVPTVANGDIVNGGKLYRLHLRNDVYWHDDNPTGVRQQFTSADVKYSFEKSLLRFHSRAKNMIPSLQSWDSTNNVASIDPCTAGELDPGEDPNFCVAFHFSVPYAPLLAQLNVTEAAMIPKHVLCAAGCTGATPSSIQLQANVIGTGPFMCPNPGGSPPCSSGSDGKVVKNPRYWRGTQYPYFDAIVMRPITDNNARTTALKNGDVDWVWDVLETRVSEINGTSNLRTAPTQSLGGGPNSMDQVIFNLWDQSATPATITGGTAAPHPIFGNTTIIDPGDGTGPQTRGLLVRRAFSHAIDRNAYLATRGGVGTVGTAPISSELAAHATDITLPNFDQAKARSLLAAAGWMDEGGTYRVWRGGAAPGLTDGQTLAVSYICGSATLCARVDTLGTQLLSVGINVQKVDCSGNGGAPNCNTGGFTSTNDRIFTKRKFDLYILNFAQGYDPHVGVRRQYHSTQITTAAGAVPNNAPGYINSAVDADFDNAAATVDPAARNALYHDAQVRIAQDKPYVWLIETPNVRGYSSACSGFQEWTGLFAEFGNCRR